MHTKEKTMRTMRKIPLPIAAAMAILSAGSLMPNRAEATALGASAGVRLAAEAVNPVANVWHYGYGGYGGYGYGYRPYGYGYRGYGGYGYRPRYYYGGYGGGYGYRGYGGGYGGYGYRGYGGYGGY